MLGRYAKRQSVFTALPWIVALRAGELPAPVPEKTELEPQPHFPIKSVYIGEPAQWRLSDH